MRLFIFSLNMVLSLALGAEMNKKFLWTDFYVLQIEDAQGNKLVNFFDETFVPNVSAPMQIGFFIGEFFVTFSSDFSPYPNTYNYSITGLFRINALEPPKIPFCQKIMGDFKLRCYREKDRFYIYNLKTPNPKNMALRRDSGYVPNNAAFIRDIDRYFLPSEFLKSSGSWAKYLSKQLHLKDNNIRIGEVFEQYREISSKRLQKKRVILFCNNSPKKQVMSCFSSEVGYMKYNKANVRWID